MSAPTGFVEALKISLVHCAPRASFSAIMFMPGRVSKLGQFFDFFHRSVGRLERADPGVTLNVITDVPGRDDVAGGKSGAANHELHMLRDNFFVAHAVLNRADRAVVIENVRGLFDGDAGMNALGGDDAVVAARNFLASLVALSRSGKVRRSRKPQAVLAGWRRCALSIHRMPTLHVSHDFARCAANMLPTAPQPTMQTFIHAVTSRPFGAGVKLPGHIRQAFAFVLADAVSVLRIEAHLAVLIDDLRMQTEKIMFS